MSTEKPMSKILPVDVQQDVRTVVIDVRRHPDKNGDAITALGEKQIRIVADRDHRGFVYHLFGCSGAERTDQTVRAMMDEIGMPPSVEVEILPGLHYGPGMEMADITNDDFGPAEERVTALCAEESRDQTVGDWHKELPLYSLAMQASVTATLMNVACRLATKVAPGVVPRALLAAHSPVTEMAVTDFSFPRLAVSAGVRYTLTVEKGEAKIVKFEHLEHADDTCVTAAAPSLQGAKK